MSLRETAAADLVAILQDPNGFSWPVTVTRPGGPSIDLVGLSTDISQTIDPETGQAITGRNASITLVIATLLENFLALPVGVAEGAPWTVHFNDINGAPHTFKVLESLPDRALGCIVCILEFYKPPFPSF